MSDQVPIMATIPVQPQTQNAGNVSFILDAQDPSGVIDSIRLFLRGERMVQDPNDRTRWIAEKSGRPYVNEQGVAALCGIIQGKVNKIVLNGNYKETMTINTIMVDFGETLSDFIRIHYQEWDMDLGSQNIVYWIIIDLVDSVYSQTFDPSPEGVGGWRKFGMSTYNFQEVRDTSQPKPQQNSNPLSSLPFLGGSKR